MTVSPSPTSPENLIVETDAGVAIVTVNRPKVLNALNDKLVTELGAQLDLFERDADIGCVILTGSEKAGASLAGLAAKNIKKSVLELGGSDALLVLDDADVQNAAQTAILSRMQNAGQSCIAAKRFFVTEKNFDLFLNVALKTVANIKQGDPTDPSVQMGPMARLDLAEALEKQLKDAVAKGAKVVAGGERASDRQIIDFR